MGDSQRECCNEVDGGVGQEPRERQLGPSLLKRSRLQRQPPPAKYHSERDALLPASPGASDWTTLLAAKPWLSAQRETKSTWPQIITLSLLSRNTAENSILSGVPYAQQLAMLIVMILLTSLPSFPSAGPIAAVYGISEDWNIMW